MNWPVRWLLPVERALNVYETMTAVNGAMNRLEGEALLNWQRENKRAVETALAIQALRDELDNGG